jgi:hypothetical protein
MNNKRKVFSSSIIILLPSQSNDLITEEMTIRILKKVNEIESLPNNSVVFCEGEDIKKIKEIIDALPNGYFVLDDGTTLDPSAV